MKICDVYGKLILETKRWTGEGFNLSRENLTRADLTRADLTRAKLTGADLTEADLTGANLTEADLTRANLTMADLIRANLTGSDLTRADLSWADLTRADLTGANLANVKRIETTNQYNVLKRQEKLILYKYLRTDYTSPVKRYKYEIGETYWSENANEDRRISCGAGFNVATLNWCLKATCYSPNYVYVEVEVNGKDLIIPYGSDGKFRLRSGACMKILRELDKKEIEGIW